MNKEDKITFEDLSNWLDRPLSNSDIDLINFILTSIENRYKHLELQAKVTQLESNIAEAIKLIVEDYYSKTTIDINSIGYTCNKLIKVKQILERGIQ